MIQRRSSPDDWFHKNATPKQRTNLDIYGRTLYITRARSQVALAGGVRGLWVNRPGIGSGAGIQTPMHVTTDKSQLSLALILSFSSPNTKHTRALECGTGCCGGTNRSDGHPLVVNPEATAPWSVVMVWHFCAYNYTF